MVEELVPAVEDGPLRVQDHQAFLFQAQAATVRRWGVSFGPANQGPANRKYLASLTSAIFITFFKNLEESNLEPNIKSDIFRERKVKKGISKVHSKFTQCYKKNYMHIFF